MYKSVLIPLIGGLLLAGLAGCSGTPPRGEGVSEEDVAERREPQESAATSATSAPPKPLTPDVIYSILVGEIAAQRGQLGMASSHYRLAAKLSQDARTAERAARIAVFMGDWEAARDAVEIWVNLEPDSPAAHKVAAALYARERETERAVEHLRKLVGLSEDQHVNGFMQAVVVTGKMQDQQYGLELMRHIMVGYENDPKALYAYAAVAAGAREFDDAETSILKALQSRPDWPEAVVLLSRIRMLKGDVAGALSVLQQAVSDKPDNLILRTAYARQLVDADQTEPAYEQFSKLLEIQPQSPDLMFSAGVLALKLGKYDQARDHLEALNEEGSRKSEAAYYLGQTEELDGNLEAAAAWYGRVSGTYKTDAEIHRARMLAHLDRFDEARDLIQRLRVQEPEQAVKLYLIEAEILRRAKRSREVMELYDIALKSNPNNADLLYDRGLYAVELGRLDILERDLSQVIKDNPDHADALNALGYTLADQTSRYQEALGFIQRALALKPDNPAVLDSMGWVQYRLGNNQEALRYLRRALEILPDAEIAAHLGEVLWVTGAHNEARRVWKDALAQNPESEQLQQLMQHGPGRR